MTTQPVSATLKQQAVASLAANGKTFYWASFFLGKERAAVAALLYSGCRQLDDIADNCSGDDALNRRLLDKIRVEIEQSESTDIHQVSMIFRYLIQAHGVDVAAITNLLDGLIQDTHPIRFTQQQELDRYCYRVAGTVGIMMCSVLGVRDTNALPFAIDLGIAMQLTNISRDVLEDANLGRRYLPVHTPVELLCCAPDNEREKTSRIINTQLERAELFYKSGITGLTYLPRGSRVAIYLAAVLYRAIGRKLRRKGCCWWQGRTVVSKHQKMLMTVLSFSNLGWLLVKPGPSSGASHNQALHKNLTGLPYADI